MYPIVSEVILTVSNTVLRNCDCFRIGPTGRREMIRKLKSGKYRLYSRKADAKTGKRKNLGTFDTREAAEKHERAVQFFKRRG